MHDSYQKHYLAHAGQKATRNLEFVLSIEYTNTYMVADGLQIRAHLGLKNPVHISTRRL